MEEEEVVVVDVVSDGGREGKAIVVSLCVG